MPARTDYAPGEFCWFDLASRDRFAAAAFYRDLFDWQAHWGMAEHGPPYAELHFEDVAIAGLGELSAELQDQGAPPIWNAYVAVADVTASAQRAASLGGRILAEPRTINDAGRLAFVVDPGGATFGLWQADQHVGSGRFGEPGACCWTELATHDLDQARTFYGELFGWTFRTNPDAPGPYLIATAPDTPKGRDAAGLMQMTDEWGDAPAQWTNYFAVSDASDSCATIRAAGGQVLVDPFETPHGPIALVADPQGARFNLWQFRSPGA